MPTTTVVFPSAARGPGTALFGPVVVPSTIVGYAILFDRTLFTNPATAILAWVDLSLDGGTTWLGHPLENLIFDSLGIPRQVISHYSAVGDKGTPTPPLAFKDNQWPGGLAGQVVPVFLNNPHDPTLTGSVGSALRRVRGGIIILGTVTTSLTLVTYP